MANQVKISNQMKKYQFIYTKEIFSEDYTISIIQAKSIVSACGKFVSARKNIQYTLRLDYEVIDLSTDSFINISNIKSVENFIY